MEDDDNTGGEQVIIIMPVFASVKRVDFISFHIVIYRTAEQHPRANEIFADSYPSDLRETGYKR